MKTIYAALLLGIAATGCSSTVTPINTASGDSATLIECKRSMGNCYEKANEICPSGYRTVSENQGSGGAALVGTSTGIYGGMKVDRRIVVQCK